jgi:hypothetical protein
VLALAPETVSSLLVEQRKRFARSGANAAVGMPPYTESLVTKNATLINVLMTRLEDLCLPLRVTLDLQHPHYMGRPLLHTWEASCC